MQATLHTRLLRLISMPVLALLITGISAASTSAQITSREVVDNGNSLDVYTYYAQGVFSQVHLDDSGNFFTYTFDFHTGRSTRIIVSTSNGFPSASAYDSELGIINIGDGWFGSPFYTSGNPFDASVQDSFALLMQELPNFDPWGEVPGERPRFSPIQP